MLRSFVVSAALLSCFASAGWAQSPSAPTAPATSASAKLHAKKPATKAKAAAKQPVAAGSGPCGIGVIAATGDLFTVQKIGLTIFGIEFAEVPTPWGFDDLIFARVRAAAGAVPVRRINFAKGAFDSYYHPKPNLFRDGRGEFTTLIRQIAGNIGCERYVVVTRFDGQLDGTNQTLSGVGIVNRGTSLLSRTYLFAYIKVAVFDGHTFEIRRDPLESFEARLARVAANLTKNENMREIDNSAFPATPPEAANSATLRDGARGLLAERLDQILPAYFKE